jgi:N-methylhydantoinase B
MDVTNTLNTPIEALERDFPVLVERYALRPRSGGAGRYRGGDGLVRRLRFLTNVTVTILSERRRFPPMVFWEVRQADGGRTYSKEVLARRSCRGR